MQDNKKKECFVYCKRNAYNESDELINYIAGPANISISPWAEEIIVSLSDPYWNFLLDNLKETVIEAWELTDDDYVLEDSIIKIKINYKIVLLYLGHNIVYYDY